MQESLPVSRELWPLVDAGILTSVSAIIACVIVVGCSRTTRGKSCSESFYAIDQRNSKHRQLSQTPRFENGTRSRCHPLFHVRSFRDRDQPAEHQ